MIREETPQIQMVAVFEIANQGVERKSIGPHRGCAIKARVVSGAVRAR
jgi:hypothetical protein